MAFIIMGNYMFFQQDDEAGTSRFGRPRKRAAKARRTPSPSVPPTKSGKKGRKPAATATAGSPPPPTQREATNQDTSGATESSGQDQAAATTEAVPEKSNASQGLDSTVASLSTASLIEIISAVVDKKLNQQNLTASVGGTTSTSSDKTVNVESSSNESQNATSSNATSSNIISSGANTPTVSPSNVIQQAYQGESTGSNVVGYNVLNMLRPLDSHVEATTKGKIWKGEFVEMSSLLKVSSSESYSKGPTLLSMDSMGNIVLSPNKPEKISHIGRWNEAWRIFSSIAQQNPSLSDAQALRLSGELLQYAQHINALNDDQADWRYYDDNFRMFKQHNPVPFNVVDYTLVGQANSNARQKPFTSRSSSTPRPSSYTMTYDAQEAKQKLEKFQITPGFCFKFLAGMQCTGRCNYKHLCPWCLEAHTVFSCKNKVYKRSDSQQTQARPYPGRNAHNGANREGNASGDRTQPGRYNGNQPQYTPRNYSAYGNQNKKS